MVAVPTQTQTEQGGINGNTASRNYHPRMQSPTGTTALKGIQWNKFTWREFPLRQEVEGMGAVIGKDALMWA